MLEGIYDAKNHTAKNVYVTIKGKHLASCNLRTIQKTVKLNTHKGSVKKRKEKKRKKERKY